MDIHSDGTKRWLCRSSGFQLSGEGLLQRLDRPHSGSSQDLSELEPRFFNGIQIGEQGGRFGLTGCDEVLDAVHLLGRQIIYDDHASGMSRSGQSTCCSLTVKTSPSLADSTVISAHDAPRFKIAQIGR